MSDIIFLVEEAAEGGFTARALFTEADTIQQLREEVRDAVRCHFEDDAPASLLIPSFPRKRESRYRGFN